MNRNQKILNHVKKTGAGLEIGPGHSPIAPKSDGYNVHIVDHLDQKGLIEKFQNIEQNTYKNLKIDLGRVEKVDFVWGGESYLELTGSPNYYDWIIASHVIEHTPNLIGFINDCESVLKETGVLSLVIPDKRFCFDRFRPLTSISKIIDAHHRSDTFHTPGTACEYYLNVVSKGEKIAWGQEHEGLYQFLHSQSETKNALEISRDTKKYLDFHAWCFTPTSFRLMIQDLNSLGLIQMNEISFFPSNGFEFFVTLGQLGEGPKTERLEMLKEIEREVSFEYLKSWEKSASRIYRKFRKKIRTYL